MTIIEIIEVFITFQSSGQCRVQYFITETKTVANTRLTKKQKCMCDFRKYGAALFMRLSHVLIFLKESFLQKGTYTQRRCCTERQRLQKAVYKHGESESLGYMLDPVLNYSKALKWLIHLSWVEHWAVTKEQVTFIPK